MRLAEYPLFLDQSIHRLMAGWMRLQQLDVVAASEFGLETAPDGEVLRWANAQGRALLTHDIGFGRRAMRDPALKVGVVLFRKAHRGLDETVRQVRSALEVDLDMSPPFLLVVDTAADGRVTFRVRNLPGAH